MGQRIHARRATTTVSAVLLAMACVATHTPALRAQEEPTQVPEPTPTPAPTPIPAAEIPGSAEQAESKFRELIQDAAPVEEITKIEEGFATAEQTIEKLSAETEALLAEDLTSAQLYDVGNRWLRRQSNLDGWLATLRARATALEENLASIRMETELWRLTGESAHELDLPPAMRDTVASTLEAAEKARAVTAERRDEVLTLQTKVSDLKTRIADELVPIRQGIEEQRKSIFMPEQQPIWRAEAAPPGDRTLATTFRNTLQRHGQSIALYGQEEAAQLAWHGLVFLSILIVLILLHRRAAEQSDTDESLEAAARLLARPIAAAVLLSTLVQKWFHPRAPAEWTRLLSVVLLLALLRLLPRLIPRRLRPGLILVVVAILLWNIIVLLPDSVALYRWLLAVESALTLGSLLWAARKLDPEGTPAASGWNRVIVRACRIGATLMAIALVGNVIGSVNLAELLTRGTLIGVYTALLVWAGAVIVRGAESVLLRTPAAQKLNMVRSYPERIRAVTGKVIRFIAITTWLYFTLAAFDLLGWTSANLSGLFKAQISIGQFSFSPFTVIPVLIAVWLTFKISKLIRFFLETDVFSRVTMPRGLPATISTIANYIVLTIGFFIVAAMLGLDLTKLTIVAGALSVGIGFGLQNIVNNFVSGLILLFERPIKEGDKIEVETVSGVVQKIGIRASIVKTWQGAEVVVPNADLISGKLVNWTLSDMRRRIEIPVGVAYGTDPGTVMQVLLDVAGRHPDVLEDPAPGVPFMNFGDSSLDFELRCWTVEDFVRVGTELRVEITRTLAAHGIEIPFPQRDLHLHSTESAPPPGLATHAREDTTGPPDARQPVPPSEEGQAGPDVNLGADGDSDR
jgi:small-conductance mechanosensitive channel